MKIKQAAEYLSVSTKTLRRWEQQGWLSSKRTPGNQRQYTPEQLDQFQHQPRTALPAAAVPVPWRKISLALASLMILAGSPLFASHFMNETPLPPIATIIPTAPKVLCESIESENFVFTVNVPSRFNRDITAPNVIYSLKAGDGIAITGGQNPTVKNTLALTAGSGITIDGLKITNSDKGSSTNVFKTIAVSGQSDVV